MGRPGLHWPNTPAEDTPSRARLTRGRFAAAVILTVSAIADARWLARESTVRLVVTRIYEPAGDLAAPADVAARHVPWIQELDPSGYYQLLNEPDVEYSAKTPEQFASWWEQCAGYILHDCPAARLGFPAPSIAGSDEYLHRVAAAGGLRRASWIGERGYWRGGVSGIGSQVSGESMRDPRFGYRWERSLPYRLPIVLTEFGNSDPGTAKVDPTPAPPPPMGEGDQGPRSKATQYLDYCASLPRFVVAAGAFIGAGGDPHWDTPAGGAMWIDDAMAGAIGAGEGEWVMDAAVEARVRQYAGLIQRFAGAVSVPASIVAGLIAVESGGQADATSPDNGAGLGRALGLMQVLQGAFAAGENGYDPETNIRVGTRILREKLNTFGGRLESGLAAYFGAVDSIGNPTSGSDLTGTTGVQYVAEVKGAAASFGDLDGVVSSPGAADSARADADFLAYAPKTGTWREAAINLKGVADDALTAGRKIVADGAATWAGR
jgi:hypothetical protein